VTASTLTWRPCKLLRLCNDVCNWSHWEHFTNL